MAQQPIEVRGTLTNLARKVGKKGGERIEFKISSTDTAKWNRLIGHAQEDVVVTLLPSQGELPEGEK